MVDNNKISFNEQFSNMDHKWSFIGNWNEGEKQFLNTRYGVEKEQFVNFEET